MHIEIFMDFFSEVLGIASRSDNPNVVWDDAVTLGIKVLCARWCVCIFLWTISYLLIMCQVISGDSFVSWTALLFIPMWMGSLFVVIAVILVLSSTCSNMRFISLEQRMYNFARNNVLDTTESIDYESLPLLRRLFFWGVTSALFAILIIVAQILVYLWLVENAIGMWNALCPVIFVFVLLLCYMFAMRTISLATCSVATLILLEMILFTIKISGEVATMSWILASAPIVIVQLFWGIHLAFVFTCDLKGSYQLTSKQRLCLFSYAISLILCLVAEGITCTADGSAAEPAQVLWAVAVPIFVTAGVIILREESSLIAASRGYTEPQSLSKTEDGWEPLSGSVITSLLLGTISMSLPVIPEHTTSGSELEKKTGPGKVSAYSSFGKTILRKSSGELADLL